MEMFDYETTPDYLETLIDNAVKATRYNHHDDSCVTFDRIENDYRLIISTGTEYVDSVCKLALQIALLAPYTISNYDDDIREVQTIYNEYLSNKYNHPDGERFTQLYLREDYSQFLVENPPVGLTIKVQPPFDNNKSGRVIYQCLDDRMIVQLSHNENKRSQLVSVLRYLYGVDLFARTGNLIPPNVDIDHINDDRRDDRLANAQQLTRAKNILKYRINLGLRKVVIICPICGNHIHRLPEDTSMATSKKRPHGRITLCSDRCSMIYTLSIRRPLEYESLRRWIEKHQLYKIIRVWDDGKIEDEKELSSEMLSFDFMSKYGHLVDFDSSLFLSKRNRMELFVKYKSEGLNNRQIGRIMGASRGSVHKWNVNMSKIDYDISRLDELDVNAHRSNTLYKKITDLLDKGNNNYQTSQILHISPSTVLRVLKRFNDDRGSMTNNLQR